MPIKVSFLLSTTTISAPWKSDFNIFNYLDSLFFLILPICTLLISDLLYTAPIDHGAAYRTNTPIFIFILFLSTSLSHLPYYFHSAFFLFLIEFQWAFSFWILLGKGKVTWKFFNIVMLIFASWRNQRLQVGIIKLS